MEQGAKDGLRKIWKVLATGFLVELPSPGERVQTVIKFAVHVLQEHFYIFPLPRNKKVRRETWPLGVSLGHEATWGYFCGDALYTGGQFLKAYIWATCRSNLKFPSGTVHTI